MDNPDTLHERDDIDKDRRYVTALGRGLRILRCFGGDQASLSVQEIARMTGLPQPTAWRLCFTLLQEGFLVCSGEPHRMALGLPALALGHAAQRHQPLPKVALPPMQALTEQHRLGTSLAIRDGVEMLYLQRTHGDFVYFNDPVGARRPFAVAPTAWACYAAYGETERTSLARLLERQSPATWPETAARLAQAREEFAQHGFVTNIGAMHPQLNAVAVPIRSLRSEKVYALSASGLAAQWPRRKLLAIGRELVELAAQLTVAAD